MPGGGPRGSWVDLGARCVVPAKPWPTGAFGGPETLLD